MKLKHYIEEIRKQEERVYIINFGCLVNIYIGQNRLQVMVLAELSKIQQTWQNLVEVMDVTDIVDIMVETGRQNMAEHGRTWQIAVDCGNLVIGL